METLAGTSSSASISNTESERRALEIYEYAESLADFELNDYVRTVFFGVHERRKEISELIDPNLVGWNKKRISPVSRAIISLAVFEMLAMEDVPARVAINEAVELAKKFGADDDSSYINGVLGTIAKIEDNV